MSDPDAQSAAAAPAADSDVDDPDPEPGSFWRELPLLLAIAVVVAVLVRTFVLQSFWIPSGSMENTLINGDRVLVNKTVYHFTEPARGEVVVFKAPMEWRADPADEDFIKRVVGVGGDTVSYDAEDQALSINGDTLDESAYLYQDAATGEQDLPSKDSFEFSVTVPQGRLWVLGDHRSASGDSRENYIRSDGDAQRATVSVEAVVGRAFVVMWPLNRWDWLSSPDAYEELREPDAAAGVGESAILGAPCAGGT